MSIEPLSALEQRDERAGVGEYLQFEVSVTSDEGSATVQVKGDLDSYTSPRLRTALLALVEDGARHVTLDIAGTQFVDSTGLSVLVGGLKRLRDHGGTMVVKSPTAATRKLFEITGVRTLLQMP